MVWRHFIFGLFVLVCVFLILLIVISHKRIMWRFSNLARMFTFILTQGWSDLCSRGSKSLWPSNVFEFNKWGIPEGNYVPSMFPMGHWMYQFWEKIETWSYCSLFWINFRKNVVSCQLSALQIVNFINLSLSLNFHNVLFCCVIEGKWPHSLSSL